MTHVVMQTGITLLPAVIHRAEVVGGRLGLLAQKSNTLSFQPYVTSSSISL
jgi:hypothetical protein